MSRLKKVKTIEKPATNEKIIEQEKEDKGKKNIDKKKKMIEISIASSQKFNTKLYLNKQHVF